MIEPEKIEAMAQTIFNELYQLLPNSAQDIPDALKRKLKTGIKVGLEELEFVSREEFEVQKKVLAKTRQKVEALEKLLEDKLNPS